MQHGLEQGWDQLRDADKRKDVECGYVNDKDRDSRPVHSVKPAWESREVWAIRKEEDRLTHP